MKIQFLWARLPGYLAGICQLLKNNYGHEVSVVGIGNDNLGPGESPVSETLFSGLQRVELSERQANDAFYIENLVANDSPDVLVVSGWQYRGYRAIYGSKRIRHIPVVLASDNTLKRTWRQWAGKLVLRRLLQRASRIWVPGKSGRDLMDYWGVPEEKVLGGLYSVDEVRVRSFSDRGVNRMAREPSFLFVGQLIERKGFHLLCEAYSRYRSSVESPWGLSVCGRGPLEPLVRAEGIKYNGFVDGADLPKHLYRSSVFVLPSLYDAWGVVVAEAACAGLPIIGSRSCGAVADLLDHKKNGLRIDSGSIDQIYKALLWFHKSDISARKEMGSHSELMCQPFHASQVAKTVNHAFSNVLTDFSRKSGFRDDRETL